MPVDLSEVGDVCNEINGPTPGINWLLLGYEGRNKIVVKSSGKGGIEELKGHLAPDNIAYGLLRCQLQSDESSESRTKFVKITWVGECVKGFAKGRALQDAKEVHSLFNFAHLDIAASTLEDVSNARIQYLIQKSAGGLYGSSMVTNLCPPTFENQHIAQKPLKKEEKVDKVIEEKVDKAIEEKVVVVEDKSEARPALATEEGKIPPTVAPEEVSEIAEPEKEDEVEVRLTLPAITPEQRRESLSNYLVKKNSIPPLGNSPATFYVWTDINDAPKEPVRKLSNRICTHVASGDNHYAVVLDGYDLFTFGAPNLGTESVENRPWPPKQLPISSNSVRTFITSISLNAQHGGFVTDEGLFMWGQPEFLPRFPKEHSALSLSRCQLIDAPKKIPLPFISNQIVSISCGRFHTALITDQGELYTFGKGSRGELGHGDKLSKFKPTLVQDFVRQNIKISQVACGFQFTIVRTESSHAYGFGSHAYGQLGIGETEEKFFDSPELITSDIDSVACGEAHSLFLTTSGVVYSCGSNTNGQLGIGLDSSSLLPVERLKEFGPFRYISCGPFQSAAISESKIGFVWGNFLGCQKNPQPIPMDDVAEIACGEMFCVVRTKKGKGRLFAKEMKSLLESKLFSDWSITVQGEEFHLHKAIIAQRCPELFELKNTKTINLKVFKALLEYIYTDTVPSFVLAQSEKVVTIPKHGTLGPALRKAFLSDDFKDITLVAQGKEIKAHKCILVHRSPVFRHMLAGSFAENQQSTIVFKDIKYSVLYQIILWCYTNDTKAVLAYAAQQTNEESDEQIILHLLLAAHRFGLTSLIRRVEMVISESIDVENVGTLYNISESTLSYPLQDACFTFMTSALLSQPNTDELIEKFKADVGEDVIKEVVDASKRIAEKDTDLGKLRKSCRKNKELYEQERRQLIEEDSNDNRYSMLFYIWEQLNNPHI